MLVNQALEIHACQSNVKLPFALSNLLLLPRHRNRRTHNFAGLGIDDLHYLLMIPIVERARLRPPVQFFQPLSSFISASFPSIAKFTVWTVDSRQSGCAWSNGVSYRWRLHATN
jgi:hypothetical protein